MDLKTINKANELLGEIKELENILAVFQGKAPNKVIGMKLVMSGMSENSGSGLIEAVHPKVFEVLKKSAISCFQKSIKELQDELKKL